MYKWKKMIFNKKDYFPLYKINKKYKTYITKIL